jgi:hypothetical protein
MIISGKEIWLSAFGCDFASHNFTRLRQNLWERNSIYKHTPNYFSISTASLRCVSLWGGWNMVLLSLENILSYLMAIVLTSLDDNFSSYLVTREKCVIKMEEKKGSHAVAITRIISTVWKCLIYAVMSVRLKRCCMQIIIHKVEWEKRVSQIFPQLSSMIAVVFEFELRIDIFIALDDNEKVPSCAAWVRIIDPWKLNF